jgi:hypothetical protein
MGSNPSRRLESLVLGTLVLWGTEAQVLAYVDPGSGGLVWQAVIAALVGAAFYFRGHLGRLFSRNRRQDPPADNG